MNPRNYHVNTEEACPSERSSLIFPMRGSDDDPILEYFRVCGEAISGPRDDPVQREAAGPV